MAALSVVQGPGWSRPRVSAVLRDGGRGGMPAAFDVVMPWRGGGAGGPLSSSGVV